MAGIVVATGFLFNFVARGVIDTYMVFILPLEAEFAWSRSTLTGVYSAYLVVAGLMSPVAGTLLDRWGPRWTYGIGLAVLAGGMGAASTTTALWQIYVFHGVCGGIAAACLGIVPAAALIGRWFDRKLSLAIAFAYAGFGSGILVIVPLAQGLIDADGWRAAYRTLSLALVALLPVLLILPWGRIARGDPALMAARGQLPPDAVGSVAPPASAVSERGWTIASAMRTPEFWLLVQCFFFTACSTYSVVVQTVTFLVDEGYPPLEAAFAFGASGMLSIVGVLTSGWLAARKGFRFTVTLSFAATLVGILALLSFSYLPAAGLVLVYVLAFGVSQGARGPVISTLSARIFARGQVGAIFGAIFMTMSFGSALGAWITGFLHDLTGDYRAAFLFSAASVIGAVSPFWYSKRLRDPGPLPWPADGKMRGETP
ncbi:MFS transporter [Frigidibacter albus]|uniref:MFS transporter n=1 Tax=Frigidibacter albus TaxID=1465486 RepID=A0A6L8VDF2_9RHOB|nr:MFS transporter [Frigidibacter albus]MZQ87652.1 MFS transporter [Frigidibacter albus]NBE29558.1 MFS transporter [Frigidibacter albus]GGH44131.1 MFS transporter [Frigidibacter albus]